MRYFYAIHDNNQTLKSVGAIPLNTIDKARKRNEDGYGIFMPVNEFKSDKRVKGNLEKINAVFVDLDEGSKIEQMQKIDACPLSPTLMVESKNGFHVYWGLSDDLVELYGAEVATVKYENFLRLNIIPIFGADKAAADVTRLLRVPEYNHCKNPDDLFEVKEFFSNDNSYTWQQLLDTFPQIIKDKPKIVVEVKGDNLWARAGSLNCEYALDKLSGMACVNSEVFTFSDTQKGNKNIIVDGKGCSCWIDQNGLIGSSAGGGPTVVQWLEYYGNSKAEIAKILEETFPELKDNLDSMTIKA